VYALVSCQTKSQVTLKKTEKQGGKGRDRARKEIKKFQKNGK
jgi:hypothetical protein